MKSPIIVAALLASVTSFQVNAQKYYIRQHLPNLKTASGVPASGPTSPTEPAEPDKPAEPVGPCASTPYAYNPIRGSSVTIGRYVATRIPAQMCSGGDVIAPTGTRHLFLQADSNMVVYFNAGQSDAKWASSTQYTDAKTLATQPDGNVQLLRNDGSVVWSTGTSGNPGAFAAMAQSGSMIVVSANGRNIIWSTNTDVFDAANVDDGTVKNADNVPGTVVPAVVERNEVIPAPNGICKFAVQNDSNLVIYRGGNAIWASGTQYSDGYRLVTLANGNIQFNRANGSTVFTTNTAGNPGARMRMQSDCDLAVYASDGKTMLWHSNTAAKDILIAG